MSSHTHTHTRRQLDFIILPVISALRDNSLHVFVCSQPRDPTPSIDRETEWRMKRERLLYEGVQLKINAHKTASMSRGGDKAPVTGSYLAVHWASGKKGKKPEG